MFTLKWWIILGYYIVMLLFVVIFNSYLKKKTGSDLTGSFDIKQIPKHLFGIFILGIIGSIIVLIYPIGFLFYPKIVELTLPIIPIQSELSGLLEIIGVIFIISGLLIELLAAAQLGTSTRFLLPEEETKLITSGIYAISRNPIYLGGYLSFLDCFSYYQPLFIS